MRAIRVHAFGGPDQLRLEDSPIPVPGAGQALLRVEAAGVNYIDVYHRTGLYPQPLPLTLGREAAGTVETIGPGVMAVRPGDRVVCETTIGGYAEYCLASAERLVPLPDRVSARLGAAVLLQGLTAHYLARSTYPLRRDDVCLVHAAAGGLGQLLCQMASRIGARVIATVSTEEKAALAREFSQRVVPFFESRQLRPVIERVVPFERIADAHAEMAANTTFGKLVLRW